MHGLSTGRSNEKPRKRERSQHVLRGYAELHRGRACEFCAASPGEKGQTVGGTEIHHILGGSSKTDEDWNLVFICAGHHRHPEYGFHGAKPLWTAERAFALKLAQGYALPPAAWAFLPEGRDACPTPEPSQKANRRVTEERCS